jgi:hypothetical protein
VKGLTAGGDLVEGADELLTLAEFAVALAGFMGVVMVFRRGDAALHPVDSHRIQVGLAVTLGPAFLALLPAGLSLAGLSAAALWRLCSTLGALFLVGVFVFEALSRSRLPSAASALLSPTVVRISQTVAGFAFTMQVVNASGLWLEPGAGLYFLALVLSLAFGALVFVRTVFIRPGGPSA